MLSKGLAKVSGILALCLLTCAAASAQYGGGGGTGGGTGGTGTGSTGSSGYGSGNGKAIGIGVGVAAGAAVGIVLLVRHNRHSAAHADASLTGCTQSVLNGISLKNESDNQTYMILSKDKAVQPGERLEVNGVIAKGGNGLQAFRVKGVVKDYGACGSASAGITGSVAGSNQIAQILK